MPTAMAATVSDQPHVLAYARMCTHVHACASVTPDNGPHTAPIYHVGAVRFRQAEQMFNFGTPILPRSVSQTFGATCRVV